MLALKYIHTYIHTKNIHTYMIYTYIHTSIYTYTCCLSSKAFKLTVIKALTPDNNNYPNIFIHSLFSLSSNKG